MPDVLVAARGKTPAISSGKIQRGFDWNKDLDHPRSFKDYDITWNVEGCREPEIFDLSKDTVVFREG